MMDFFQEAVSGFMWIFYAVFDILWGDFITIPLPGGSSLGISLLVLILIPSGIYFTIRTRFLPFRMFPDMIRVVTEKKSEGPKGAISGVQALIVSTATRVGMGNLVGVVAAISAGGAGAVFWMWLIALLGSSTAFAEATLAQLPPLLQRLPWPSFTRKKIPFTEDTGAALPIISTTFSERTEKGRKSLYWLVYSHCPAWFAGAGSAR